MKILVVSDSHGRWGALYNVIQSYPDAKVVIHLGDGHDDLERIRPEFTDRVMVSVAGNCDCFAPSGVRSSAAITLDDKVIFYTHGHNYRVKSGESLVEQAARSRGADICLYGHTHIPKFIDNGEYIYINTGSVSIPKENSEHSYIILEDNKFIFKNLDGEEYARNTL